MRFRPLAGGLAATAVLLLVASSAVRGQAPPADTRAIVHLTGNLYYAQSDTDFADRLMVIAAPDGIAVSNPGTSAYATWLKNELARRFPSVPVRYVILHEYNHDHLGGTEVFPDARIVTSDEIVRKLTTGSFEYAPTPGDSYDRNYDNRLERRETEGSLLRGWDQFDTDKDGALTPKEVYGIVRKPEETFTGRKMITLGTQRFELIERPGRSGSVGGLVDVYFPDEKVLYVADYVPSRRLYPAWGDFDHAPMKEWIAAFRQLESLDFLVYVPSPWQFGTKRDLTALRQFMEDLEQEVSKGIAAGRLVENLKRGVRLDKYAAWQDYERNLPWHVESAYYNLTLYNSPCRNVPSVPGRGDPMCKRRP